MNKSLFQKENSSRFWNMLVFDIPGISKYAIYDFVALEELLQLMSLLT